MSYKKLVPIIYLKDTKAYSDEALTNLISDDAVSVADSFSANGADEIIIMDLSYALYISAILSLPKRSQTSFIIIIFDSRDSSRRAAFAPA